jgi:hypothetical protein
MRLISEKVVAVAAILTLAASVPAAVTVVDGTATVSTQADLVEALDNEDVSTVVLTKTIKLSGETVLAANSRANGLRKVVRVAKPFIPETGKITLVNSRFSSNLDEIQTPEEDEYSTYNLFDITADAHVVISNLTLMGGFKGSRVCKGNNYSVGGINNAGKLEMIETDITRTGTALLTRPGAISILYRCNIVRNANWYGGGVLNYRDELDRYGIVVMDRCSLTENQSLGPSHGGGAAENQGCMYLNNCVIANNASTEIGGGINNCKEGQLYVMNCTFTGNVTTSKEYGITAGGAIGNAGGAGNVYVVNSVLAHNGFDAGATVQASSIGRYKGSTSGHLCHLANSVVDATAGMDRIDATDITVSTDGLFAGYTTSGIIASGGKYPDDNGIYHTSDFSHPNVAPPDSGTDPYAFAPRMASVETNNYVFTLSVETYFDYSKVLSGEEPSMGYLSGESIIALGPDTQTPTAAMMVKVTFSGETRLVDDMGVAHNVIGALTVDPLLNPSTPLPPGVFEVRLGSFTGGKVSGVTVYGDSYVSNSVVTVHAVANSAHYLNGWIINGERVPDSEQKYIFSFSVVTNILITPIFNPVITQIYRARQRYPWNNLVDIDYSVAETNAVKYRLVFLATYEDNGTNCTIQLKHYRKNADVSVVQRLGEREDLHRAGDHRVTWDSAADGVDLKGKRVHYRILACEGEER